MKPSSMCSINYSKPLLPQTKINETLAKLLKAADNSVSYSKLNINNKQMQEKQLYKTKSTTLKNKLRPKRISFIDKPHKPERETYLNTSYSPQQSQTKLKTRIQTEPPILSSNQSYLNSLIKQRIPTSIENKHEPSYMLEAIKNNLERIKGKTHSTELLFSSNKNGKTFHRRHKTLLNISNETSVNLSNLTSNYIQMPKINDNKNISSSVSVEGMLKEFLQSNLNEKNLSVLGYLEKFFDLLDYLQKFDVAYGLVKEIVHLPFRRISEQFENIKGLYKEKIMKTEFLLKEKEKSDLMIKGVLKQNCDLKNKLKEYEDILEKLKKDQDIFSNEIPRPKSRYSIGIENKVPNINIVSNNSNLDSNKIQTKGTKGSKKEFDEGMKQRLRLNLDIVRKNMMDEEMRIEYGKMNEVAQKNIIGFHDEFMSKFEEFSISWKNKALQENNKFN